MQIFKALLLCTLLSSSGVFAHGGQHDDQDTPLSTMTKPNGLGSASLNLLEKEIEIFDGYGKGMFFLNAANEEQEYINQGYAALNVFHYADAYRSFRMATVINNDSVFGYAGLIFSIADQDGSAEAKKLVVDILNQVSTIASTKNLTAQEQAWIDYARAIYLEKMGGTTAGLTDSTYKSLNDAFQKLGQVDGNNVEFLAYVHWTIFSGNTASYVQQIEEAVLKAYPNHAGAAHYLLHIAEMMNDMDSAKAYGEILARLALGSAHAQHMLGHTLPQFGLWQEALDMFLIADQIHHYWANKNQVDIHEDWHYAHNLDLMAAAYLGLGNDRKAYDTWAMAMPYDFRAVPKAIGVLLATNRLVEVEALISQLEQNGSQWVAYLAKYRYEMELLKNPLNAPQNKSFTQPGSYEYLVEGLRKIGSNKINETSLISGVKSYFTNRLTAGGFDGWSNSFVELLRLKNIAEKLGAGTIVSEIDLIIDASKNGTL